MPLPGLLHIDVLIPLLPHMLLHCISSPPLSQPPLTMQHVDHSVPFSCCSKHVYTCRNLMSLHSLRPFRGLTSDPWTQEISWPPPRVTDSPKQRLPLQLPFYCQHFLLCLALQTPRRPAMPHIATRISWGHEVSLPWTGMYCHPESRNWQQGRWKPRSHKPLEPRVMFHNKNGGGKPAGSFKQASEGSFSYLAVVTGPQGTAGGRSHEADAATSH
jgi:hypothetical protein